MKKNLFLINPQSGSFEHLDSISDDVVKEQVLIVEGIDSEFISDFAIGMENDSYTYFGKFLISKYSNYAGSEDLSIKVGKVKVISIKRIVPKIEFEISFIKDGISEPFNRVFKSVHEALKTLSQE